MWLLGFNGQRFEVHKLWAVLRVKYLAQEEAFFEEERLREMGFKASKSRGGLKNWENMSQEESPGAG